MSLNAVTNIQYTTWEVYYKESTDTLYSFTINHDDLIHGLREQIHTIIQRMYILYYLK